MPTLKKRVNFFETEEGVKFEQALRHMVADSSYNTTSSYSADSVTYPDNLIPFVEKHKAYLNAHPAINPQIYLANLRLMTRLRK